LPQRTTTDAPRDRSRRILAVRIPARLAPNRSARRPNEPAHSGRRRQQPEQRLRRGPASFRGGPPADDRGKPRVARLGCRRQRPRRALHDHPHHTARPRPRSQRPRRGDRELAGYPSTRGGESLARFLRNPSPELAARAPRRLRRGNEHTMNAVATSRAKRSRAADRVSRLRSPRGLVVTRGYGTSKDRFWGLSAAGRRRVRAADYIDLDRLLELKGERCPSARGVSLRANAVVAAHAQRGLDPCSATSPGPPIASERLSHLEDRRLLCRFRHRWRHGITHVVFDPRS